MGYLRNTFAVLMGLLVAAIIITLGIRLNPRWVTFEEFAPFKHWRTLLYNVRKDEAFFIFLLIFGGLGSVVGGVTTAILVKYAKVAYAILIGFMLLVIAMLDVIINPYHPTFYKILIFLTFFPFAWMGGKVTEIIYEKNKRKKLKLEKLMSPIIKKEDKD